MREQISVLEALQKIDSELRELELHLTEYPNKISTLEQEIQTSKEKWNSPEVFELSTDETLNGSTTIADDLGDFAS